MLNVKITDRDLRLLKDLYDYSFMSFYQIKEDHFDGLAASTIYNRLSKLVKADLVGVIRVKLNETPEIKNEVGAIYKITKTGLKVIKKHLLSNFFRCEPVSIQFNQIEHDLLLTDVMRKIKKSHSNQRVINSKHLGNHLKDYSQIPDAVVFEQNNDQKTSIEVELTMKSEARYRDIILNYELDSNFSKVRYFVRSKQVMDKIKSIACSNRNQSKFSFVILKDYLKENQVSAQTNQKEANHEF